MLSFNTERVQAVESFIIEGNDPFILLANEWHGCWWPGDTRSQDISINGIDL